jgi:hypothetical protein
MLYIQGFVGLMVLGLAAYLGMLAVLALAFKLFDWVFGPLDLYPASGGGKRPAAVFHRSILAICSNESREVRDEIRRLTRLVEARQPSKRIS